MAPFTPEIAGLHFKNPIIAGAGPLTGSGAQLAEIAASGAGAAVTRTISVLPGPADIKAEVRGGLLHMQSWSSLSINQWVQNELPVARAAADANGMPLIVSVGYTAEEVSEIAPLVAPFADAIELSTHYLRPGGRMVDVNETVAVAHGLPSNFLFKDPAPLVAAIRAAKGASHLPLFVKIGQAAGTELITLGQTIESAGADGIVAINSFGPVMGLNIETKGFALDVPDGHAWLSGTSIKPLALRCVFDLARAVKIPVIGSGGVGRAEDVAEYLMAGAGAVEVTTAALKTGGRFYGKLAERFSTWAVGKGYVDQASMQGLAIRRWNEMQPHRFTVPILYDVAECIGCRLCELSCHYQAIYMVPGANKAGGAEIAEFNADRCFGCGLCVVRCPTDALLMPMLQKNGTYLNPKSQQPVVPGAGSIK
jgi:dihydroorotate dehydrogenase (NAD+) catalytic subunit